MSRHERRYQRYLARKWQKQARKTSKPREAGAMAPQIATAANSPIHEALVPAKLFELGMGNLVFSRSLPDGRITLGVFLLDVFCLGVKNAFVATVARDEYAQRLSSWSTVESFQPMQPACFRKLVEGGIAYAHDLEFSPHEDYAVASQIFGDVESTACPTRFEYAGLAWIAAQTHSRPLACHRRTDSSGHDFAGYEIREVEFDGRHPPPPSRVR